MNFNDMDYDKDYKKKDTFNLHPSPNETNSKPRPNFNEEYYGRDDDYDDLDGNIGKNYRPNRLGDGPSGGLISDDVPSNAYGADKNQNHMRRDSVSSDGDGGDGYGYLDKGERMWSEATSGRGGDFLYGGRGESSETVNRRNYSSAKDTSSPLNKKLLGQDD